MSVPTYSGTPDDKMRSMLQAGVHFGHQAKRWNPRMKPYIHSERNGIHVIDLDQTLPLLDNALELVQTTTSNGNSILFVGTKKQAQEIVANAAERSGQFYINRRWLGGTLTNFVTIRQRLRLLKDLERQDANGELDRLPKQEAAAKRQELERLQRTLGGMKDMVALPSALFIVDAKREQLAIAEARKLGIPVIAMTDTNADPDVIDYVIPSNDDAIRAIRLISNAVADAAVAGRMEREAFDPESSSQDVAADWAEDISDEAIDEDASETDKDA